MHISIADNREKWNEFVLKNSTDEFLQSWEWGDFQRSYGRRVWRFIVNDFDGPVAQALTVCVRLPRKKCYVYIPRGPIIKSNLAKERLDDVWSLLTQNWRLVALESNAIFTSIEPGGRAESNHRVLNDEISILLSEQKWMATKPIQPQYTMVLDLTKTPDDILSGMHQKTRYNTRLSEKKGLSIKQTIDKGALDTFWELLKETERREAISMYDFSYYRKLINILGEGVTGYSKRHAVANLWLVSLGDMALASAIVILFGNTAYYLYGSSESKNRNFMAPYFMHWNIIKWAKEHGYTSYDFWGVKPPRASALHPWTGITRFKAGFGGKLFEYIGTFTFPYSRRWYNIYRLARWLKYRR